MQPIPPKKESLLERVGALYRLLESRFPEYRSKQGHLDIAKLALDNGYSHETVYRCVRRDIIKVPVAMRLIKFSHETPGALPIYWDDLVPYVLPGYSHYRAPVSAE